MNHISYLLGYFKLGILYYIAQLHYYYYHKYFTTFDWLVDILIGLQLAIVALL